MLVTTIYHILANSDIHERLRAELMEAIPRPDDMVEWRVLEGLPYLVSFCHQLLCSVLVYFALGTEPERGRE